MKLNSKGQVTIPAALRHKHHLHEGDEVEVIEKDGALHIVRAEDHLSHGQRLVRGMRGKATTSMSTEELMELLRGE